MKGPGSRVGPGVFEFCYSTSTLYSAFQSFSITVELSLPRPNRTWYLLPSLWHMIVILLPMPSFLCHVSCLLICSHDRANVVQWPPPATTLCSLSQWNWQEVVFTVLWIPFSFFKKIYSNELLPSKEHLKSSCLGHQWLPCCQMLASPHSLWLNSSQLSIYLFIMFLLTSM